MSDIPRHELTRAEFKERYGIEPSPDVIGTCFVANGEIVEEFVFTDEIIPFGKQNQITELERLKNL